MNIHSLITYSLIGTPIYFEQAKQVYEWSKSRTEKYQSATILLGFAAKPIPTAAYCTEENDKFEQIKALDI